MATATLEQKTSRFSPGLAAWFGLLALLLAIGLYSAFRVFYYGLATTAMNDTVPWGLWITIDLSSIALGAGAFTLSAVVYLFGLKRFQPILRLAIFVGFIGYTSALLTLLMDIGRPDRFWHPWVYWNIHSVLWEITMCITIYLTIMVVEFLPVIAESPIFDGWVRFRKFAHSLHGLTPLLAALGLGISLLHQSSLGATYGIVKARPIWFKPSMPIMFILSAIAVGPAVTMSIAFVLEWITAKRTVAHNILFAIAKTSGLTLLVYGYLRFWDAMATLYYGRTPAVEAAWELLTKNTPYNFSFWVLELIVGVLLPAVLFLSKRYNRRPIFLVLGTLLAMVGIVTNRWNVTVSGLTVPLAYSPGQLYTAPVGSYFPNATEWGIAVLIIGYGLTLLTLGVMFLPLFPKEEAQHE
ncbi:MAG: NrfD/PsrC family molybdoenzyme membrane anchor subunit [Chloroflexota bacterium]